MRSAVRAVLFPASRPVYSGYSSWRGIAPGAHGYTALQQYWGPHAEFGMVRVADDETYWYGYVAMPERTVIADELGAARERFAGWASPVQEVMAATPPEAVLRHDVHHLPGGLPRYTTGRVVMVGDAAHGTLPTMGQGAATALEDGLCVGLLVGAPVATGGGWPPPWTVSTPPAGPGAAPWPGPRSPRAALDPTSAAAGARPCGTASCA